MKCSDHRMLRQHTPHLLAASSICGLILVRLTEGPEAKMTRGARASCRLPRASLGA
jgi:hypothetical protein